MGQTQFAGVQAENAVGARLAVERVAENGAAAVQAMQAGLVGAAGLEQEAEPGGVGTAAQHPHRARGGFAARGDVGKSAGTGRRDLRLDFLNTAVPDAIDEGPIQFADAVVFKELGQGGVVAGGLAQQDDAAGEPVEAVAGVHGSAAVSGGPLLEISLAVAAALGEQARRFVEREQVGVFKEDVGGGGGRHGTEHSWGGRRGGRERRANLATRAGI